MRPEDSLVNDQFANASRSSGSKARSGPAEPLPAGADYPPVAYDYDLMVIGSGPAGQKAGIQAAKLGRRVALVDRGHMIGGVCINTGTIPSKTLREAVLYLTGMHQRGIYGELPGEARDHRRRPVRRTPTSSSGRSMWCGTSWRRNRIRVIGGEARFIDPHTVGIRGEDGGDRSLSAARILIAVGTRPARPASVAFDGRTILDSDDIVSLDWIPSSLVVVGAGVIGIEYASMFAAVGTKVTVIEQRDRLLPFCDAQMIEALQYHLRDLGVIFRFGERVVGVEKHPTGAITHLASGKRIAGRGRALLRRPPGRRRRAAWTGGARGGHPGRITVNRTFAPPCATSTRPAM